MIYAHFGIGILAALWMVYLDMEDEDFDWPVFGLPFAVLLGPISLVGVAFRKLGGD